MSAFIHYCDHYYLIVEHPGGIYSSRINLETGKPIYSLSFHQLRYENARHMISEKNLLWSGEEKDLCDSLILKVILRHKL